MPCRCSTLSLWLCNVWPWMASVTFSNLMILTIRGRNVAVCIQLTHCVGYASLNSNIDAKATLLFIFHLSIDDYDASKSHGVCSADRDRDGFFGTCRLLFQLKESNLSCSIFILYISDGLFYRKLFLFYYLTTGGDFSWTNGNRRIHTQ